MFASTCSFTKNYPLCMGYHPYHFVGEDLLHPVYIYIFLSEMSAWNVSAKALCCLRGIPSNKHQVIKSMEYNYSMLQNFFIKNILNHFGTLQWAYNVKMSCKTAQGRNRLASTQLLQFDEFVIETYCHGEENFKGKLESLEFKRGIVGYQRNMWPVAILT